MVIMLNNYYKMFDDSMSKYQVYKVNCVNDSHMIVSGNNSIFWADPMSHDDIDKKCQKSYDHM